IGLMDNVARELAHCADVMVLSVGYRLAPEHPYPAGLEDCETVTRWAFGNASRLGVSPDRMVVAGGSARGNLAAAVARPLGGGGGAAVAGTRRRPVGRRGADAPGRRRGVAGPPLPRRVRRHRAVAHDDGSVLGALHGRARPRARAVRRALARRDPRRSAARD